MDDSISRRMAVDALNKLDVSDGVGISSIACDLQKEAVRSIENLPPAQQTLYGYKIEHLAYIASVMEKEGVTAEYAVRTFDDMSIAIKMIIEEVQQKVEETLNERFN